MSLETFFPVHIVKIIHNKLLRILEKSQATGQNTSAAAVLFFTTTNLTLFADLRPHAHDTCNRIPMA